MVRWFGGSMVWWLGGLVVGWFGGYVEIIIIDFIVLLSELKKLLVILSPSSYFV